MQLSALKNREVKCSEVNLSAVKNREVKRSIVQSSAVKNSAWMCEGVSEEHACQRRSAYTVARRVGHHSRAGA